MKEYLIYSKNMKIKEIINFTIIIFLAVLSSSCATFISGRTQKFPVNTIPPGATVTIGDIQKVSPAVFVLDRRVEMYKVKITKEGYEPFIVVLVRGTNPWLWGGVATGGVAAGAIGGIVSVGIDDTSGAINKFLPDELSVVLEKKLNKN